MTESVILVNDLLTTAAKREGFVVAETADTLDPGNGHTIDPAGYQSVILALHVSASTNGDDLVVEAGDNPPAVRQGIGDLTYTFTGGAKELVLKLETARFIQDDGLIHISSGTYVSLAGTADCYGV